MEGGLEMTTRAAGVGGVVVVAGGSATTTREKHSLVAAGGTMGAGAGAAAAAATAGSFVLGTVASTNGPLGPDTRDLDTASPSLGSDSGPGSPTSPKPTAPLLGGGQGGGGGGRSPVMLGSMARSVTSSRPQIPLVSIPTSPGANSVPMGAGLPRSFEAANAVAQRLDDIEARIDRRLNQMLGLLKKMNAAVSSGDAGSLLT